MLIKLLAVDRDSSDGYTSFVTVKNQDDLNEAWSEFEKSVPYCRWYPDNQFESGTPDEEAYFDIWNDSLIK